jgi:hypothetical protein
MSKSYASGEEPRVGDEVHLGLGEGPKAKVIVVVGGPNSGAKEGFTVEEWEYLGPGILVDAEGMGLVYEEDPDEETILIKRHT